MLCKKLDVFIAIIRALASFPSAAVALAIVLSASPSFALENIAYVTATGSGTSCTAAAPCADVGTAILAIGSQGRVVCLNGNAPQDPGLNTSVLSGTFVDIDCPQGLVGHLQFFTTGAPTATVRIQHLTFRGDEGLLFQTGGTLILDDCVFLDTFSTFMALDIEPNGPLNLVIKNSRISNNGAAVFLKPAAGGSINATFDHVMITDNTGGGIKADSSNGPISVDISDSVISENTANGLNISSGTGTQNDLVNITRSTIAKNGLVGIQTGGSNGAVMLDATLLDSNVNGATSLVGAGRILSYGNNRIVGSAGSGFSGSLGMQ
jgi:hypothetical protein